jgi:hypothetical protein
MSCTLQCDALQTKPWVAVDRAGQVHGTIDANRGETVPPEDLTAVFEDPSVFAELASRRAGEKKVANACLAALSYPQPPAVRRGLCGLSGPRRARPTRRLPRRSSARGKPCESVAFLS